MRWPAGSTPCWMIEPLAPHDAWALALNNAHAVQLSWLDAPRFAELVERVFVDRVVVAAEARGRGQARRLYEALFDRACRAGHDAIVCEVNIEPPNPVSRAFHRAMGFEMVGSADLPVGKRVRYLRRALSGDP